MDEKFLPELNATVHKWVKDGALKMYNDYKAQGKAIPVSLQKYIDNGLKRESEGLVAYPVTKGGKHNPMLICLSVRMLVEKINMPEAKAISKTAEVLKMSKRQVKETYMEYKDKTAPEVIYYLITIW